MSSPKGRSERAAVVAVGLLVLALLVARTVEALLVLFGGYLFALVLGALASGLARRFPIPYVVWVVILVLLLVGSSVAFIVVAGPSLRDQFLELADLLPKVIHDLGARLRHASLAPESGSAGANVSQVALGAFAAVGTSLEIVGGLAVMFFIGVYGAARPSDYTRLALAFVPRVRRVRALRIIRDVNRNVARWLLGRLVAMLFVGVSCAIAFSLLKLPLAMSLALLAGLLTFVEYVGALVSAVPPVLIALSQSTTTALLVVVTYTMLHLIEGYVLTPLLARVSVRFPPGLTLAGQILFAALVGPLGLTFSTPLIIVGGSIASSLRPSSYRPRPRRRSM